MTALELTPDELLTTTRSVRRRLDLSRPVERSVLLECLRIAQQAPNGGNLQNGHFVVVSDPEQRARLAELARRRGLARFRGIVDSITAADEASLARRRIYSGALYLLERLDQVPVLVVPCVLVPRDEASAPPSPFPYATMVRSAWLSIIPAAWSFMLAARARGIGTCWSTGYLEFEEEAADVLGIAYDQVTQVGMIATAYTRGTDFKPGSRRPVEEIVHWDRW